MKIHFGLMCVALFLLTSCSEKGGDVVLDLVAPEQHAPGEADYAKASLEATVPQLAYEYTYLIQADRKDIASLSVSDQAACEKAGAGHCQIINYRAGTGPNDSGNAKLTLRVSPQWLKAWQSGLHQSLASHNGRIFDEEITSEDLSFRIVDTEAHLRNQEALRDRLQLLIRTHNGSVSELVEAETQLSKVQEKIDASRSSLAVMKTRVSTVKLNINYYTVAFKEAPDAISPVIRAVKGFWHAFMEMLGFLITVFAYMLPFAIISIPTFILGRKWLRARKAKKAPKDGA